MRLRRSALISPGDNQKLLEKLAAGEQDVAVLELEDGVHEAKKEFARTLSAKLLGQLDWRGRERIVRTNHIMSEHGRRDIEAIVAGKPDAILLPKVQSVDEVKVADELLTKAEKKHGVAVGSTLIWSMIETAKGLVAVDDIARAHPRMTAILFGGGDLGADLQVKRLGLGAVRRTGFPAFEYFYGRGRTVAAARAAGIDPIDVGHSTYTDVEGTRRAAEYSAQMGFSGVIVFSPRQVATINDVFTPPADDVAWATESVTKFEEAGKNEERTVVVVEGEMIDGPFVLNARQILARQKAIAARNAR